MADNIPRISFETEDGTTYYLAHLEITSIEGEYIVYAGKKLPTSPEVISQIVEMKKEYELSMFNSDKASYTKALENDIQEMVRNVVTETVANHLDKTIDVSIIDDSAEVLMTTKMRLDSETKRLGELANTLESKLNMIESIEGSTEKLEKLIKTLSLLTVE